MRHEGFKLEDYEIIKRNAEAAGLHLVIDNNRDGVRNFAKYNKSFLSRKLNAAGFVTVFALRPEFLPWNEKLVCEYVFEV